MNQGISLLVYPVSDAAAAKKLFSTYLGVEPYVDGAYYIGFKVGDQEVGLDPNAHRQGVSTPIAYRDVADIRASVQALLDAGAQLKREVTDVGYGLLVATVQDADGNIVGLRQQS